MTGGLNLWQFFFFLSAALFVAFQIVRGWRLGVVRQLFNMFGLAAGYAVAIFGGRLAAPILRPIGFPNVLSSMIAGAVLGLVIFGAISALGAILFKKTAQQSFGLIRLSYGAGGSAIGVLFGFLMVWFAVLGIRLLGSIAEAEVQSPSFESSPRAHGAPVAPGRMVKNLARMKTSLEEGRAGAVVQHIDPMPTRTYAIIAKIGSMISSVENMDRFLDYPGAQHLTQHPKIRALQTDPKIVQEVQERNYFALLRNERIVNAVNDPEISTLVRNFELEKALDYALRK